MGNINKKSELFFIKSIEKSYSDINKDISKIMNFKHRTLSAYSYTYNKVGPSPIAIFDFNLTKDNTKKKLVSIKKKIKLGKYPNRICTGPLTKPKNFPKYLEEEGFKLDFNTSGMAIDFKDICTSNKELPINTELIIVNNSNLAFDYSKVLCTELFKNDSDQFVNNFSDIVKALLVNKKYKLFAALSYGYVVSTAILYFNDGIAGIYYVATENGYEGKGLAYSVVKMALLYAKEKGYTFAVLQATDLGKILYSKIGFKQYSVLGRYKLEL